MYNYRYFLQEAVAIVKFLPSELGAMLAAPYARVCSIVNTLLPS